MTKAKTTDPLSERLQQQRTDLLAQIETCERDIEAAILDSGKRVVAAAGNVRIEESALAPVVRLRTKKDVLVAALGQLEAKIEAAPGKIAAYEASLEPLQAALTARDALREDTERLLGELLTRLMSLREANESAYSALRVAAKAYHAAGGAAVPGLTRPSFPPVRFDSDAARALGRSCPFAAAPLQMHGDTSGRSQEIIYGAGGNEE